MRKWKYSSVCWTVFILNWFGLRESLCLRVIFSSPLTKNNSSYNLCTLAFWDMASRAKRVAAVDLYEIQVRGNPNGLWKLKLTCSLEGSLMPRDPSNQAGELRVEPIWFYQKAAAIMKARQSLGMAGKWRQTSKTRHPISEKIWGWDA